MSRRLLFVATLVATLSLAARADEPLPSVEQVMNEHKEKIRNQLETINYKRKRMVEANMALDGTEAETFWPIYSRYRGETDSLHNRVKMGPMSRGTDAASWLRDIQRADGHLLMSGPCRAIPHCCNRLRAKEVAEVLCGCCQICPGFNLGSKPSRCGTRLKASNQAWKRERSAKEQGSNKRFT
ncbi:hypothetical protein ACSEU0_26110 [Pseudomonas aeruginosa]